MIDVNQMWFYHLPHSEGFCLSTGGGGGGGAVRRGRGYPSLPQTGQGYPSALLPRTGYAASSMPLAVTQDFLAFEVRNYLLQAGPNVVPGNTTFNCN